MLMIFLGLLFFLYIFSLAVPIGSAVTETDDLSKPKELIKKKSGKDYRTRDHLSLFYKYCFRIVKSELLGKCPENIAKVQFDRHSTRDVFNCAKQANFRNRRDPKQLSFERSIDKLYIEMNSSASLKSFTKKRSSR